MNTASASQAVVAGGGKNQAQGILSAIGGGAYNLTQADFATISGGGPSDTANSTTTNNRVYDNYGTIGGGANNRAGSDDGNTTTSQFATIGGGTSNQAGADATVGGGDTNRATGGYSTISGGKGNWSMGNYGTIGGGINNHADATTTTVGGGENNLVTFGWGTVSGGYSNGAEGGYASVGGGYLNLASNQAATVAGGWTNHADGNASTIPGGANNTASGAYSFAAGAQAIASQSGTFVWADTTNHSFDPFAYPTAGGIANSFNARATGGVYLVTGVNASTGVPTAGMYLAGGGSGWNVFSDRSFKMNFQGVNGLNILDRLVAIPISSWNYKTQAASIRHIGPMAQDFNSAFGVGEADKSGDKKYINSIDADGVALAAIQGLYQLNQQQAAEIQSLKTQLSQMKTSGPPHTTSSLPIVWVVVIVLGLSQVGMFLALRRRMGGRS